MSERRIPQSRARLAIATLRAPLVGAAEALEKRALAIQEWPFDDRTMTRIVAISTSVIAAILGRFLMHALGL